MRILLDSNILISFLLNPPDDNPIAQVVRSVVARRCELLFPSDLIAELKLTLQSKKHLARRLTADELESLIDVLSFGAVEVPEIPGDIPALTRDPKDDYLLACAILGQADYIITGDDDLLSLREVEGVKMVSARAFCEILGEE